MRVAFIIVVSIFIESSFGLSKDLRYESMNTNGSLVGLACTLGRFSDARGVRFNTQTQECESLPDTWYLSKTIDLAYHYYIQTMTENPFEPVSLLFNWSLSPFLTVFSHITVTRLPCE